MGRAHRERPMRAAAIAAPVHRMCLCRRITAPALPARLTRAVIIVALVADAVMSPPTMAPARRARLMRAAVIVAYDF